MYRVADKSLLCRRVLGVDSSLLRPASLALRPAHVFGDLNERLDDAVCKTLDMLMPTSSMGKSSKKDSFEAMAS
eukprot:3049953-Lingulodinium_polyedra.AAC.1